jgi:hypothetical protein
VAAAGGVCAPAVSAVADSAAAGLVVGDSGVEASMAVVAGANIRRSSVTKNDEMPVLEEC